jgi:UPF0271 protein
MSYVLDASAIISGYVEEKGLTVPEVIQEVKDLSSEFTLESLISSGKLDILEPSVKAVAKVRNAVKETRDTLSETDIKVIALALDVDGCVVSGDYGIQNVCEVLGVSYVSSGVEGIEKVFEWRYECVGCGQKYDEPVKECPFCGNKVVRKKSKEVATHVDSGEKCKSGREKNNKGE